MSFVNFLTEAKKPTFKTLVSKVFDGIKNSSIMSYSEFKPLKFFKSSSEYATFTIVGYKDLSDIKSVEDDLEYIFKDLGFDKRQLSRVKFKKSLRGEETEIKSDDLEVNVSITKFNEDERYRVIIEFEIKGKDLKVETDFDEYPEFKPGAILHGTYGYNMTGNVFYKIMRRTNKTITCTLMGRKIVSGDGTQGYEVPDEKKLKMSETATARIKDDYCVIDGNLLRIWDGRPQIYTSD